MSALMLDCYRLTSVIARWFSCALVPSCCTLCMLVGSNFTFRWCAPYGAAVRELSALLLSLIMTLQVLILHPVRPGVTPRFTLTPCCTNMAAGRFAAFIHLLRSCDVHSGSLPFGVMVLYMFSPFWGHLHTAHGSLGWAALRPFPVLDCWDSSNLRPCLFDCRASWVDSYASFPCRPSFVLLWG